jgi:hypothetical protein
MPSSYLIYHPKREISTVGQYRVHHDRFGGNEDPYIWNEKFLHTYCHITQLPNEIGQINFWVSGDSFPNFNKLECDCVFVIAEKHFWCNSNKIEPRDSFVDNLQAYEHHYKWGDKKNGAHPFKRKRRYTLKADSKLSFQPQNDEGKLVDILKFLIDNGITIQQLRKGMRAGYGSKPFEIGDKIGRELYKFLNSNATIKLKGTEIAKKHPNRKLEIVGNSSSCSH